jgi:hypothetical protein
MKGMKKLIATIFGALAVALFICWYLANLRAKTNYEKLRNELFVPYAVVPMDQQTKSFLAEVQTKWTCTADEVGGPSSDVVKLAGMDPSVSNLIGLWNYQMPEYSWWSPARNRKPAVIALLKAKFFPSSVDRTFHVSDDGHEALLWGRTNMVYIYRDEAGGMREALYVKKKSTIEQNGAANGSQPSRRETNRPSSEPPSGLLQLR